MLKDYAAPMQIFEVTLTFPPSEDKIYNKTEPRKETVSTFTSLPKPKKPVFMPSPAPVITTKCGETIQLPSLYSAQQSTITTSFDFRAAINFMSAISVDQIGVSDTFC